MPRGHYPDNYGVSQVTHSTPRPYGTCHKCLKVKPIYWVSVGVCLCYHCMKTVGAQPYSRSVPVDNPPPPSLQEKRGVRPKRIKKQKAPKHQPQQLQKPPRVINRTEKQVSPPPPPKTRQWERKQMADRKAQERRSTQEDYNERSSWGVRPDTRSRWEENRKAVERARLLRLKQELDE